MQEMLGAHPNSHIIYPLPGRHCISPTSPTVSNGKARLVYVGSVENFYGRMLNSLIERVEATDDLDLVVVGPNADWPSDILERAQKKKIYLGFKPPEEAAAILASADALLVVMSFEPEHRLFMQTSFTTKFLDYTAFHKPIILWGPEYSTPVRVAQNSGGALVVTASDAAAVVSAFREIAGNRNLYSDLQHQAMNLHQGLFNPERLQGIFVREIQTLVAKQCR
jgi:hypothetical protein